MKTSKKSQSAKKPEGQPKPAKSSGKKRGKCMDVFQWTSEHDGCTKDFVTTAMSAEDAIAAAKIAPAKAWYLDVCTDQRLRDMAMKRPGVIFMRDMSLSCNPYEEYIPPKDKR